MRRGCLRRRDPIGRDSSWTHIRKRGGSDYLFGESTYVALSLAAESLLARQVFVATLM
jgi:hypothetical protein